MIELVLSKKGAATEMLMIHFISWFGYFKSLKISPIRISFGEGFSNLSEGFFKLKFICKKYGVFDQAECLAEFLTLTEIEEWPKLIMVTLGDSVKNYHILDGVIWD